MKPNATNTETPGSENGVEPYKQAAFDAYLTFCALGGMMVSDTGEISGMTLDQFCEANGVNRTTCWRWKKETVGLADMIRKRRDELVPLARETAALNRLYLIGNTSLPTGFKEVKTVKRLKDGTVIETTRQIPVGQLHEDQRAAVDALKTYLGHHSKLRLPTQPIEHEVGDALVDALSIARNRQEALKSSAIEGEVVEPVTNPGS